MRSNDANPFHPQIKQNIKRPPETLRKKIMRFRMKNLSFGTRLTIIVLFPLMAFIGALGFLLSHAVHETESIEKLKAVPRFATSASALIHNLQIERGLSAGYLGSKGSKFSAKLASHASNTDKTIRAFRDDIALESLKLLSPDVEEQIQKILSQLDQIESTRTNIRSQNWPVKQAVAWYTQINNRLLGVIETLASASTQSQISRLGLATVNFMNIKERAGIIRAVLANTFAADHFAPGMRDRFITLLAQQDVYAQKFNHFADTNARQAYDRLTRDPVFIETARMIDTARKQDSGFGYDATEWFNKQTQKINLLKKMEDDLTHQSLELMETLASAANTRLWTEIVVGFMVLLATIGLSYGLIRRLSAESEALSGALKKISEGDLSDPKIDFEGPAFEALICMRNKLIDVTSAIEKVTHTVRTSAREIATANTSLAQRAEEQAANLEKTAASMEEITATVKLSSENQQQGKQLSDEANRMANEGKLIVGKAVEAMNEINDDSKKIADIINVIDEIAFQTNLLALNAAVEAARAGEQGRGFAVVASEVRNLAQRSAEAAQEIKTLIEASVKKIHSGSDLVNASGKSLQGIVEAVTKVSTLISEISTAGREQAIGVEQINESIMKLDDVNQQNASMVEEVAVSSKILEEQSAELESLISFYKFEGTTAKPAVEAAPTASVEPPSQPASAEPEFVERRSADRPWSDSSKAAAAITAASDDEVWEAF